MEVDFSMKNIRRCLCLDCPVQRNSRCVADKKKIMLLITQQDLDSAMRMDTDRVPGVYCSTGRAICTDIDPHEECLCSECEVWLEHSWVMVRYQSTSVSGVNFVI
ncbi:uncharacterized protein DUF2769 [Methanothermobacter defluvii]|uniref:Uncharacterized protein DUF2769 n=1 Tax=Methanothermobacter defluvii TaxID=49339 RepID=A0A371NAR5_9EURY|nr:DUF2769 domain-containing protein [Methanothermobacter defluvii]REE25250.1 uncharacterized protein DUF2769 [Methanothermobacter defluvii]